MSRPSTAGDRSVSTPSSSSTRDKLRSTLQRLNPNPPSDPEDEGEVGEVGEDDEPLTEDFEEGLEEENEDEEDNGVEDADDEEKEEKQKSRGDQSPSPDPSDAPAYAQYISRHRSRYSYSPTPRSPHSPSKPSPRQSLSQPAHRRSPSRNQLEPPSPPSRRPPNMSITITDSHTTPLPSPSPKSSTFPLPPPSCSPTKRSRGRSFSAISTPSASPLTPSTSSLQVQLAKAHSVIAERENDIKLAAQIGEMIMEENEKLEKLMQEMKIDMADREERERAAKEEVKKLKMQIEQLRKQNVTLADSSSPPPSELKSPSSSSSIQDFLRQELSAPSVVATEQYSGDMGADLRNFIRRLNAERRNHSVVMGTLKETVQRLEEERGEREKELERLTQQVRELREREDVLSKEISEMRERRREEEIEGMNERQRELIGMKQNNERVVEELEADLREEREEREAQVRMRQEAEEALLELREKMDAMRKEAEEQRQALAAAVAKAKEAEAAAAKVKVVKKAVKKPSVAPQPSPSAQSAPQSASASATASPSSSSPPGEPSIVPQLQIHVPESTQELPIVTSNASHSRSAPTSEPHSAAEGTESPFVSMPPTPSGTASDEEQRALLKQLKSYVTDVRQQLTNMRVEEIQQERKAGGTGANERSVDQMTDDERRAWLDEEERKRKEEDEREEEMARQKEKELKERLKQKAREKKAKEKAAEKEKEMQKEKERQAAAAAAEEERRRKEKEKEEQKKKEEASRPLAISIDTHSRVQRADSYSAASDSPHSAHSTTSEALTLSSASSLPTALNPSLTLPTSTITTAPSFNLPSIPFSAIDHFTLTHIQSLLSQMWAIALSLLSSTPNKTAAWYDNHHPACLHCHQKFSLIHRKHHCRLCGGLYCANCSSHKVTIEKFGYKNVRVCNTCFVMARTVVLCRKAVESGQVEYKEVVRQAEKYAAEERQKAMDAHQKQLEGEVVKEKEVAVVETPRGSTTLAMITPPLSPSLGPVGENEGVDALRTPPRKEKPKKEGLSLSPALVPFFVGGKKRKEKEAAKAAEKAEKEKKEKEKEAVPVVAPELPAEVTTASPFKVKNERMMKLIEQEKEKQKALQAQSDSALPPVHPGSGSTTSSRRSSASSSTVTSPAVGPQAAPKDPTKVKKGLGLGNKAIL